MVFSLCGAPPHCTSLTYHKVSSDLIPAGCSEAQLSAFTLLSCHCCKAPYLWLTDALQCCTGAGRATKEEVLELYATKWQCSIAQSCNSLAQVLQVPDALPLQKAIEAAWPFADQVWADGCFPPKRCFAVLHGFANP